MKFISILTLLLILPYLSGAQQHNLILATPNPIQYENLDWYIHGIFYLLVFGFSTILIYIVYFQYVAKKKRRITLHRRTDIIDELTLENTRHKKNIHRLKDELSETENLCKTIISTTDNAVCITSREGIIEYISEKGIQMYGVEKEEALIGHNITHLFQESDLLKKLLEDIVIRSDNEQLQFNAIVKNGQLLQTIVRTQVLYDTQSEPRRIVFLIEDHSESKELNHQLVVRNRYLDTIVNIQWYLSLFENDEAYRSRVLEILGMTARANRVYIFENKYDENHLLCMQLKAIWFSDKRFENNSIGSFHDTPYKSYLSRWQKILSEERIINDFVTDLPDIERSLFELYETKSVLIIPMTVNDNFFGFIGFENCLEAKTWEKLEVTLLKSVGTSLSLFEEKRLSKNALLKSEEYFRSLIQNSEDVISLLDSDGTTRYLSPSFEKVTGYKILERLGKNGLDLIHPDDVHKMRESFERIKEPNSTDRFEFRFHHKSGHFMYMETISNNLLNHPAVQAIVINYRDVTQRKSAEEVLRKSENQLRNANAMKDKLFSIIAHDLKNPFNSLINVSELLKQNYDTYNKNQIVTFIEQINDSAKATYNLLENLLQWSRSQTNRINFNPTTIKLNSLIKDNVLLLNPLAKNKLIELTGSIAEIIYIYADENMINTVLRNLITNAIKFTPLGGVITISASKVSPNFAEISVCDTGIGISDKDLSKLFRIDTSHRSVGTSGENGTGLGLILSSEFVRKNGGQIAAESELDKGSRFYFTIPLAKHCPEIEEEIEEIASIEQEKKEEYRAELEQHIQYPPELKRKIQNELLPLYEENKELLFFDQIKDFADSISKVAEEFTIDTLKEFGKELAQCTETFDAQKVTQMMNAFPKIIKLFTIE